MSKEKSEGPTFEDIGDAFARIRREGGTDWNFEHPQRDFLLAAHRVDIAGTLARLAAYRHSGQRGSLGDYDGLLDNLHQAIEMLERQRRHDHGEMPVSLRVAHSATMRARMKNRKAEAIARLRSTRIEEPYLEEARTLFAALYGEVGDSDGDARELIVKCYAHPDVSGASSGD